MASTYNLIINSNNSVGSSNSFYKYNFINGGFRITPDSQICISQLQIPYSWFNLNASFYNNTTLYYKWYRGSGLFDTYTLTFPDGFFTTDSLNTYIQQYCISQNQYFTNSITGQNLYYIQLITNTTYYANQLILLTLPTGIPSGYTVPTIVINGFTYTGFNCNPTTAGLSGGNTNYFCSVGYAYTPQVIINSYVGTASIGSIIGFTGGTYPLTTQSSSYSVLSNKTPISTNVNNLVLRCDLVNNGCSMPSDVLDSININTAFGSSILYEPSYEKWITLNTHGHFASFVIYFQDQNFNAVKIRDNNILLSLLIRVPSEKIEKPLAIKPIDFKDTQN
jgi:hypothetical protein